jgi:alpha-tubulin suppressor-like RCC1 family protein
LGDDTDWAAAQCGQWYTVALTTDGSLWAWGYNSYGQLGLGDRDHRYTPSRVGTDTDWDAVRAGDDHTVALKDDGSLWAWGRNYDGQLGIGDTDSRSTPVQVGADADWAAVEAGRYHTVAVRTDGSLWAWGRNHYGQLGLGDMDERSTPVQVGTDTDWAAVETGYYHTMALKTDGSLWAWGDNWFGQLGDGSAWEDRFIQISLVSDDPTCADPNADATGDWWITETSTDNDCGEGIKAPYRLQIRQTGSSVTAYHLNSGRTFTGGICGDTVELTGSYPEDGGTTTLDPVTATVTSDGLSGTSNWTWSDGSESCSGTTTFIGTKQ